jgi:hypothetical protein
LLVRVGDERGANGDAAEAGGGALNLFESDHGSDDYIFFAP